MPAFPAKNCGMNVALNPRMMNAAEIIPQPSWYFFPNIFGNQ